MSGGNGANATDSIAATIKFNKASMRSFTFPYITVYYFAHSSFHYSQVITRAAFSLVCVRCMFSKEINKDDKDLES